MGLWEGLFSIGLNWIFVALVCRRLFVALVCRQLFCVGLSLASPCIGFPPEIFCIGCLLSRFALWVRRQTAGCAWFQID